ncbi:hypothetical protein PCANC_20015 [Puccinia coronata f. sp. avenae]|uniref:2-dehydropantoate 2-reductase n=1 Tax=Puccinia coronata f. sp. avenae TaxID=200324 RepID=A0A2N5S9G8_9BASI|nr:hypothetical protein PCANC_20015 [Puccinia coronata f. sp. avenae]PLW46173.1 hypothetical protein PCASD_04197 [Puccinia coronata f. sp. avenae]
MRIHCIGPGSIGSLLCFHLQSVTPITLLLRTRQAQHRRSDLTLSIQLERSDRTKTATGFLYEFLGKQQQQPIESLIVTTKAPHVVPSLQRIRHRLSATSTVLLLHNGLGVVEELIDTCFQEPTSRPTFILATTSHGVHKIDKGLPGTEASCHGRFCHAGLGDIRLGVLLNTLMKARLERLATNVNVQRHQQENPILNPLSQVKPVLVEHLPNIDPETRSLHHTLSSLLHPAVAEELNPKWLSMGAFQTSALTKLAVNAAVNPVSALLETRNEMLHSDSSFDSISRRVCEEASAVFAAQTGQPFRPHHPLSAPNLQRVVADILLATRANISSMCSDLRTLATNRLSPPNTLSKPNLARIAAEQAPVKIPNYHSLINGEQQKSVKETSTEIDYINGYICRLGTQYGVETPLNHSLCDLIKLKAAAIKAGHVLPKLQRVNRRLKIIRPDDDEDIDAQAQEPNQPENSSTSKL